MQANDPVESLTGVGPAVAGKLHILGIKTVGDLIVYFPRRYDDYSKVSLISRIKPGVVTVKGEIKQIKGRYVRRGMHITEAVLSDESGSVKIVWFNQPYRANAIKNDAVYYVSGNFELSRNRLSILNPTIELESAFQLNTARIVPVYRETKGLKSATIRKIIGSIAEAILAIKENLPSAICRDHRLMTRSEALFTMHFPKSTDDLAKAKRRLGFEELFTITLAALINKQQFTSESGVYIDFDESVAKKFTSHLSFPQTDAQRKVVWQIYQDMTKSTPMNRLVEGDVGSGKTVVAAMAALMVMNNGYQVALMAPTELLALQHYESFIELFSHTEFSGTIGLLVGGLTAGQKRDMHKNIRAGKYHMVIGTHALVTDSVVTKKLGLVIIDEQHRFGVEQRKKLQAKAGKMPHVLSMTATPIPRTLALTIYGELDISLIDEMPPGRQPVITSIVSPNSLEPIYSAIKEELSSGRQMFVVCPLIEESERLPANSAEKVYENFKNKIFKDFNVGLLHGKMKSAQKDEIMMSFVEGDINILVSTTVIEVGVNIPNATVMLIQGAERFGLAQLHQLRGRVGRGAHQGYCYLVMSDSKEPPRRLRALTQTHDGFKLAELDLEIRGPGAIYGNIQSGQLDLRIANLSDHKLIASARKAASDFLESGQKLEQYKSLAKRVNKYRSITNLN